MSKIAGKIRQARENAANSRYAEWSAREDRALGKIGNPPDCTHRDVLIDALAEQWPETSGAMPHEVPPGWTFTQWASEHDYTARQIAPVNLVFPLDEREEATMEALREEEYADWWPSEERPQWDVEYERNNSPKVAEAGQAQRQA
jgi:hypothetical protein